MDILFTVIVFVISLSFLVFIHELGHFSVARLFKTKIDAFAIGFGKEIFGRTDKHGVRWKFCMIPMGGYVKFSGDAGAASNPDQELLANVSEHDKRGYFHFKPLWQKALVVAAGPLVNLILPIFIFAAFFLADGLVIRPAVIANVAEQSAAFEAGLVTGDKILTIDGVSIGRFDDIRSVVVLRPGKTVDVELERNNQPMTLPVTLGTRQFEDRFGNPHPYGYLGIGSGAGERVEVGLFGAIAEGARQTLDVARGILTTLKQLLLGIRPVTDLAGPVQLADMTAQVAKQGMLELIQFLALISINLGIINLLPIPGLDGGHLMLYAVEALKGSAIPERALEMGYRAGMSILMLFMIFVLLNDLQKVAL